MLFLQRRSADCGVARLELKLVQNKVLEWRVGCMLQKRKNGFVNISGLTCNILRGFKVYERSFNILWSEPLLKWCPEAIKTLMISLVGKRWLHTALIQPHALQFGSGGPASQLLVPSVLSIARSTGFYGTGCRVYRRHGLCGNRADQTAAVKGAHACGAVRCMTYVCG